MASDKQVEIDGNLKINGNIALNETTGKIDTTVFNLIYPAGSYYWTSDSAFNPNTSFGGVWTRVKDKMLMALGDSFTSDGGSDTRQFKLEVANLPSHTHSISHTHSYTPTGTVQSHTHKMQHYHTGTTGGMSGDTYAAFNPGNTHGAIDPSGRATDNENGSREWASNWGGSRITINLAHTHGFETSWAKKPGGSETHYTDYTQPSFTGDDATIGNMDTSTSGPTGSGSTMNLMPPYKVAYLWHRDK